MNNEEAILKTLGDIKDVLGQRQNDDLKALTLEIRDMRENYIRIDERWRVLSEQVDGYHKRTHAAEDKADKAEVLTSIVREDNVTIKKFLFGNGGKDGADKYIDRLNVDSAARKNRDRILVGWLLGLTSGVILFALNYFFTG
jgi:hypothetical protein